MKKQFLILFAFISVLALSQVPQRFNRVIVTGDITSPKFIKTGSNADSVLLGNGSARAISTIKTDTVSLSSRINAKATGNGTANGTNTGDETLTSIKTKLGAATSVSDGYLKYQDFVNFDGKQPKLNGSGFVKSFSGEITYDVNNYEIAFSKNTGFNLPLGSTPGTVLEGRTFGTAANGAVGDFQPAENQRLSTTNSPSFVSGSFSGVINSNNYSLSVPTPSNVAQYFVGNAANANNYAGQYYSGGTAHDWFVGMLPNNITGTTDSYGMGIVSSGTFTPKLYFTSTGVATFPSTVNSTGFLLNGNNLTSSLTTNYIPKWNGSNFVNATAGNDYQLPITLTTNGTSGAATLIGTNINIPNYASTGTGGSYTASISSGSNTANPVVYSSLYTKNGTVYSSIIKGYIECTGSQGNTCTFNVSTYNGSTANLSIIGVGAQGTNIILGSGSTGSNVVMSFTNPVGSGGIGFTLIIHYTN